MNAPTQLAELTPAPSAAAVQPTRSLSVVEYLIQTGASPVDVKAAFELQVKADEHQLAMLQAKRQMDKEDRAEARMLAFRKAFARFKGENVVIPHTRDVDRKASGKFSYSEFDRVCSMLSPALSKHGFGFRHDQVFGSKQWTTDGVTRDVPWVFVTCFLEHEDGHSEVLKLDGPPGDASANTEVQNMQVTGSVLKRQSVLAITGTATGGEDDESLLKPRGDLRTGPSGADTGPQSLTDDELATWRAAAQQGTKSARSHFMGMGKHKRLLASEDQKTAMWAIATAADAAASTGATLDDDGGAP